MMGRLLHSGVLLLLLAIVHDCLPYVYVASVYKEGDSLKIFPKLLDTEAVAYATYNNTMNETGWKVLNIVAGYGSRVYSDMDVMTAAGLLEGFLTQRDIHNMYSNMANVSFKGHSNEYLSKVKEFYQDQRDWMREMIKYKSSASPTWYYAGLVLAQFDGLINGYAKAAPNSQQLEEFAFDFLSGNGDFIDISNFLMPENRPDVSSLSREKLLALIYSGHCSALVKLLPGYENVYIAHSSWYTYTAMNRIYKHYAFKTAHPSLTPPTSVMSFSSYPGYLSSLDDFYIMDSGLVMVQTTNNVFNQSLYELSTPKALLAWHRVRLANWLASSGEEWAQYIEQYNSGTYNNQYMVVDMKKIDLKKAVHDGALWVVEQIPGLVESGDQTNILRNGYWPSYNVPFYENVFNLTGYSTAMEKFGPDLSYELCPRAKIFRRDQGNVKDMDSMQFIMRFNDYKNDPYSEGNPMNSICSRGDLRDPPQAGGCYDTKVTDFYLAQSQKSLAQNGPTYQNLPPFQWSATSLVTVPHLGQPNLFNFPFVMMEPLVPL